tara:strand:+ start:856 stop:1257 length:402 start_codon:yes stop_codon:yes gene_type:complete
MFRLIYVSTASETISNEDLENIVAVAVDQNAKMSITGLLLFNGTNFMQVLEGGQSDVEGLYSRIVEDNRHVSVSTILTEDTQTRVFHPWAMLFKNLPMDSPAQDARIDMADVMALKMPDHMRKIIANFDSLQG